jgi:hypothetical protein
MLNSPARYVFLILNKPLPSCDAEQPGKVCFPHSQQAKISSLKLLKCEIFHRSDVHDFYTTKPS